jgi:transcriptional regulator
MYLPKYFEETNTGALHGLIRVCPFGTLITHAANGIEANHLPFELAPEPGPFGTLRAHVARANPVWREALPESEALIIFQGPAGYISPSWYPTKQQSGEVVPTWNYAVVHARGPVRFIEDRQWLRGLVTRLTDRHEAGSAEPWHVSDAPAPFIEQLLGAIVGIEIPIRSLQGKWKLSQNRPPADRQGVVQGLSALGNDAAARLAKMIRDPGSPKI